MLPLVRRGLYKCKRGLRLFQGMLRFLVVLDQVAGKEPAFFFELVMAREKGVLCLFCQA